MKGSDGCACCRIVGTASTDARKVAPSWTVNRGIDAHDRPSFVLQVVRHRPSLADLSPDEAAQLGSVLGPLTEAIRSTTGAERVHVLYLNEGAVPHVHLHLVPRFAGDPAVVGIADPLPAGASKARAVTAADVVEVLRANVGTDRQSGVVIAAQRVAQLVQSALPYGWITARWQRRERVGDFAPRYVGAWLLALALLLLVASAIGGPVRWFCLAVAVARVCDIASYEVLILLGHDQTRTLWGYERSAVLLALNLVELVVAEAIVLRVAEGSTVGTSLMGGFGVVGLFGLPTTTTVAGAILTVVVATSALILIAGGLSLIVGLIGGEFRRKRR